jgi:hypothetical protein
MEQRRRKKKKFDIFFDLMILSDKETVITHNIFRKRMGFPQNLKNKFQKIVA